MYKYNKVVVISMGLIDTFNERKQHFCEPQSALCIQSANDIGPETQEEVEVDPLNDTQSRFSDNDQSGFEIAPCRRHMVKLSSIQE